MADVPGVVNYGRVTGRFVQFVADTTDVGNVPDEIPLTGSVTLTPLTTILRLPTTTPPRLAIIAPVVCRIVAGDLLAPGLDPTLGVSVVATDQPDGQPNQVQWTATYSLNGILTQPNPVTFNVPAGGVTDLSVVYPATADPPTVTVVSHDDAIAAQQAAADAAASAAEAANYVGAPGDPGPRGSWWWVSNPDYWDVVDVPGPLVNDQFLYPNSGDVFSYVGPIHDDWASWDYKGSIRGPQGPPGLSAYPALNVMLAPYNAVGDGVTDDTLAIQAAIDDAHAVNGGIVLIPARTFRTAAELTLYSFVRLVGEDVHTSIIKQTNPAANALAGQNLEGVEVSELSFVGPGSGTGRGISFTRQLSPLRLTWRLNMRRVIVTGFGGDGILAEQCIVSNFDTVQVDHCGGHGFNLYGVSGGAPGTSVNFTTCYADTNGGIGFNLDTMAYCSFDACATDHCGLGYRFTGCSGIALSGSGCESTEIKNGYPGDAVQVNNCTGLMVSGGFLYQCARHGVWVRGASSGIVLAGVREWYDVAGSSGNSFVFTDGASGTVIGLTYRMPVSYSGGVVSLAGLPAGGATGQVLAKQSSADGDVGWINPPSGGASGFVWMG